MNILFTPVNNDNRIVFESPMMRFTHDIFFITGVWLISFFTKEFVSLRCISLIMTGNQDS